MENISTESLVDSLTGFPMDVELRKQFKNNPEAFLHPLTVVVFDVAGLQRINREQGRPAGDKQIANLAKMIRKYLPSKSMIYRGAESEVFAIIDNENENSIIATVHQIVDSCIGRVYFGIDSLTEDLIKKGRIVVDIINNAYCYLKIRQILNHDSYYSQFLNSFITALKLVDSDTEHHVKRTQSFGQALGKSIGLNSSKLAALELLCLLHDIGKITVPLEILNKPGKLTDDEWEAIRTHTTKGYEMISHLEELQPIASGVLSHHERWDGKGYPNGLKGEEIPILARIISIVDAFDAMINDRSYRKATTAEEAKLELKKNAGTQFDPNLVEHFLKVLEENPEFNKGTTTNEEIKVYRNGSTAEIGIGLTKPVDYAEYYLDVNYLIIEIGQNFKEFMGYSAEETVGKLTQFDLIPSAEVSHYRTVARKMYERSNRAYLTHPIVHKDGTLIDVVCLGERYYDSATKQYKTRILIFKDK